MILAQGEEKKEEEGEERETIQVSGPRNRRREGGEKGIG